MPPSPSLSRCLRGGAEQTKLTAWEPAKLYHDTWSAEEMIGTKVRGDDGGEIGEVKDIIVAADGTISRVVVEVGGFLEIADQHIGVPWSELRIGQDMRWVQVPLREVRNGSYSLHGRVPRGEEVVAPPGMWRVNELVGDYASLKDVPRYGIVNDVIFDGQGRALALVVERGASRLGAAGAYAYPYPRLASDPGALEVRLPHTSQEVGRYGRFDYVRLGELSRFSSERSKRAWRQQGLEDRTPK